MRSRPTSQSFGTTITSFTGAQVKVELEAEAYQAKWRTKGAGLDPSKIYADDPLPHRDGFASAPAPSSAGRLARRRCGYGQVDWGGDPATNPAAANLLANFAGVYPFAAVEIGISGLGGFSVIFTSAAAIVDYLPQGGAPGPLTADLVDPTSTPSGALGGSALACA